ncbi:MAG: tyrosine-protein phosphatase [Rhodocyclaceae bacterium]|jgi:protein-tyrosine phosphatase|nr:tyrosine-protein phosphatase [Rhodocyclaceae bacterium]
MPLRRLPLQGAVNFRDLGGYRTSDGRQVKWNRIYRSDSLAELTDADVDAVASLGLRTLLDLRYQLERDKKPNRPLPGPLPETHAIGFYPLNNLKLFDRISEGTLTVEELDAWCCTSYRLFLPEPTFAQVLEKLLAPQAFPALIHCTSGKDRTGFASAVVLAALGVPRETIMEDFLLTNQYRRDISYLVEEKSDPAVVYALSGVQPEYLEACFNAIDSTWGSDEAYLRGGLGLSAEDQQRLQDILLEPIPAA